MSDLLVYCVAVLGPTKFCFYLLPLGAILRHHNIGYPLESLAKVNMCISDIRVCMIKNKFQINYSKTECIILRSPLLKQN